MRDSKLMSNLFTKCIKEIEDVLSGKATMTEHTKLAANTLSNYAKMKQTECHEEAIIFGKERFKYQKKIENK